MNTSKKAHEILRKFWGFDGFRPFQEEIITSVMEGRDCIALLPTGGGKSLCFQVPAVAMDGLCLVISPLVALMKDQVGRLRDLGVSAEAIYSGMGIRSIDRILDNCIYGNVKLLYMSPERLQTNLARERIKRMNISFAAIDEAHCISQWGHDFRPSYLQIPELRELHPGLPFIALTATATGDVLTDIARFLNLDTPEIFRASFARPNLSFNVLDTEDKPGHMTEAARSIAESGIVYVRSRRKTKEISSLLNAAGVRCEPYHAGMSHEERSAIQQRWLDGRTPFIACTTAFGMGIDKSNVRIVIHYDLPPSLEEYYQEAGRAGRDRKEAKCVLLYNAADEKALAESLRRSHPHPKDVLQVYRALCTQYHLPVATNEPVDHLFDMRAFCKRFRLDAFTTYHCLKILEKDGWIALSESFHSPSRVQIVVGKEALRKAQMSDETAHEILTTILRNYEGVFLEPVRISESRIAHMTEFERADVITTLNRLARDELITYTPATDLPRIIFMHPRVEFGNVSIDENRLRELRKMAAKRVDAVFAYLREEKCRQSALLRYFSEDTDVLCGKCDLCVARGSQLSADDILRAIPANGVIMEELVRQFGNARLGLVKGHLAELEAEEVIRVVGDSIIRVKRSNP